MGPWAPFLAKAPISYSGGISPILFVGVSHIPFLKDPFMDRPLVESIGLGYQH